MLIRRELNPAGARLYVAGRRVHHGAAGLVLIAASYPVRRRAIARYMIGAGLISFAHDIRDFPFTDSRNH